MEPKFKFQQPLKYMELGDQFLHKNLRIIFASNFQICLDIPEINRKNVNHARTTEVVRNWF